MAVYDYASHQATFPSDFKSQELYVIWQSAGGYFYINKGKVFTWTYDTLGNKSFQVRIEIAGIQRYVISNFLADTREELTPIVERIMKDKADELNTKFQEVRGNLTFQVGNE